MEDNNRNTSPSLETPEAPFALLNESGEEKDFLSYAKEFFLLLYAAVMPWMTILLLIGDGWEFNRRDTRPALMESPSTAIFTLVGGALYSSAYIAFAKNKSAQPAFKMTRYLFCQALPIGIYSIWATNEVFKQGNAIIQQNALDIEDNPSGLLLRKIALAISTLAGSSLAIADGIALKRDDKIGEVATPLTRPARLGFGAMFGSTSATTAVSLLRELGMNISLQTAGIVELTSTVAFTAIHGYLANESLSPFKYTLYIPWEIIMASGLITKAFGGTPSQNIYPLKTYLMGAVALIQAVSKAYHCRNRLTHTLLSPRLLEESTDDQLYHTALLDSPTLSVRSYGSIQEREASHSPV